jgi:4-hydroxy-3-polyprenylbenzoate decarboxylase
MDIQAAYREAVKTGKRHDPNIVDEADAPCKENKWFGDDIDLNKFPTPLGRFGDNGRYIQQAGLNICQTPDGKWTNWSLNRQAIVNRNTMTGLWLHGSQHNGMIHEMWEKAGKDMPFAMALGNSPAVAAQAGARAPDFVDEYDVASALLDAPLDMIKCETSDLLVPAHSEIIIEGKVSVTETTMEGPFGEYPGYLFEDAKGPRPVLNIEAVTFRNDPILPLALPGVPTDTTHICMGFFGGADIANALQDEGVPVIDALMTFESAVLFTVVRVHSDWHKRTGLSVDDFIKKIAGVFWEKRQHLGHTVDKIIVVGEDIDPSRPDLLVWALASRNHPRAGTYNFDYKGFLGTGLESYLSANEHMKHTSSAQVIYSCLPLQERIGLSRPMIMNFEENYPQALKEEVLANLDRWGFTKQ